MGGNGMQLVEARGITVENQSSDANFEEADAKLGLTRFDEDADGAVVHHSGVPPKLAWHPLDYREMKARAWKNWKLAAIQDSLGPFDRTSGSEVVSSNTRKLAGTPGCLVCLRDGAHTHSTMSEGRKIENHSLPHFVNMRLPKVIMSITAGRPELVQASLHSWMHHLP